MTLTSNGVPVPSDSAHFAPLTDSSALLIRPDALRTQFHHDGYLYLRGVLDPGAIRQLRAAYFSQFGPEYLKAHTDPANGIFSGRSPADLPPHGWPGHPAHDFVRSDCFASFVENPALTRLAEKLLDHPVTLLPRRIIRHFHNGAKVSSRAHVDFDYLDAGSDQLLTMWIPIGDCPVQTGGLVYLEDSHRRDTTQLARLRAVTDRPTDPRPISHNLSWVANQLGGRWLWADYTVGDLTIHSPHLVHASLDTTSAMMRLSIDLRFARSDNAVDPRWTTPWAGNDGY